MSRLISASIGLAMVVGLGTPAEAGVLTRWARRAAKKRVADRGMEITDRVFWGTGTVAFRVRDPVLDRLMPSSAGQSSLVLAVTMPPRARFKLGMIITGAFANSALKHETEAQPFRLLGYDHAIFPLEGTQRPISRTGRLARWLGWKRSQVVSVSDGKASIKQGPEGDVLVVEQNIGKAEQTTVTVKDPGGRTRTLTIGWSLY